MSREREWKLYFDDLLVFCEKVISYTDGLSREKFEASGLNYDATLWNVQLYGEAAKNIPESIRSQMPEIPWRELIGMRNRLAHGYFGINNAIFWQVVSIETPKLLEALRHCGISGIVGRIFSRGKPELRGSVCRRRQTDQQRVMHVKSSRWQSNSVEITLLASAK